ncbi:MAG: hypothetical protein WCY01_07315 [Alkalispirochaeta sp.]|jgi:hypothetical protein
MATEEQRRELISELDNEWNTLKHGNPIPGLYPQNGTETVKVRGTSWIEEDHTVTQYELVVTDAGKVVGRYRVLAEEVLADYSSGYSPSEDDDPTNGHGP